MRSLLFNRKGFTLIELIVVLTVIGVLTGGAALSLTSNAKNARDTRRKTDLQQIKSALEFFRSDQADGFYPQPQGSGPAATRYRMQPNPNHIYPALVPTYLDSMPHDPLTTTETIIDYDYQPRGSGGVACNNLTTGPVAGRVFCTTYTLTATLESGGTYTVSPTSVD